MARIVLLGITLTFLALVGNNLVSSQSNQADLKLKDNKYTGLLVAISDTIPYDPALLDKIKVPV